MLTIFLILSKNFSWFFFDFFKIVFFFRGSRDAWDFTLDACLCQLPAVLEGAEYVYSTFFTEQLTAFQVWLTYGSEERTPPEQLPIVLQVRIRFWFDMVKKKRLFLLRAFFKILWQVLLSQSHRLRALDLLGRFLDLGPWAVNQALSVGIFPYVLKLLQSSARELRPLLVFIWAKILAVDDVRCDLEAQLFFSSMGKSSRRKKRHWGILFLKFGIFK